MRNAQFPEVNPVVFTVMVPNLVWLPAPKVTPSPPEVHDGAESKFRIESSGGRGRLRSDGLEDRAGDKVYARDDRGVAATQPIVDFKLEGGALRDEIIAAGVVDEKINGLPGRLG